ncbi:HTH-type transcriptional regulator YdeO [Pseudomonas sp. THAF187a]|uniref:AraC family transcriptional regulator n=1 Tax=unclassified Pseudomonas TaxID=196821 RepID=UPI001267C26A|nr:MULTISPECIES: AraC family transcriptional regulator [unclassified Pseudomonas]QFT22607.1 HTH-type transcriptional regulator YdeO [Pseudomonas sp. THAF187a]QFT42794.1 HTH-type transcriptional regulator YdeO [Pseudomonas sp. THAF42]
MVRSSSVSAIAVQDLHDQLLRLGVVAATQLREAGVDGAKLLDYGPTASPIQEQRADEAQLLALWQLAANNKQMPQIGLLIGQTFNSATHGVLASWLCQCSRVSEALEVFQRHIALMNPSESWQYSETPDALVLEIAFAPDKTYPQAAIERSMSAVLRWSLEMTGVELRPLACEFAFPSPAYHARYVELFGNDLRFNSKRNRLYLPRDFLQLPILGASDYLRQMLESRAKTTLAKLQSADTLSGTVRRLIHVGLPDGMGIEPTCQALHVSRTTLYRRLKEEGTSFSRLVAEVRRELSAELIRQGLPVATVSERLGFRDTSTFHRAFKRWFDCPPGAFRD